MRRPALIAARYGLPATLLLSGVALVLLGTSDEAMALGVTLSGTAGVVLLLNVLMRAGLRSQRDRDREERARRFYDLHGRWPHRDEL